MVDAALGEVGRVVEEIVDAAVDEGLAELIDAALAEQVDGSLTHAFGAQWLARTLHLQDVSGVRPGPGCSTFSTYTGARASRAGRRSEKVRGAQAPSAAAWETVRCA